MAMPAAYTGGDDVLPSECSAGDTISTVTDLKATGSQSLTRVVLVCCFVSFTGFFHGYDNCVISDIYTMPTFRGVMGWPEVDNAEVALNESWTTNGFNAGALISAVICGYLLVDRYGRKPALIIGSVLFGLGGAVQAFADGAVHLVLGRVIAGLGVGITSCAGPAYIAEIAPSHIRGAMVGLYQSNVCVSILAAALINYLDGEAEAGWRYSLGVQFFLGTMTAVGMFFVSETPRFLEGKGRSAEALRVLTALRGGDGPAAQHELDLVRAEIEEEKAAGSASWREIFTNPFFRNVVIIGCVVQFLQIMTGINAMVSYGATLFKSLGVKNGVSLLSPDIAFTVGNAIGSFYLADRVGRRPLFIWGMVAMALTMLVGGIVGLAAPTSVGADGEERTTEAAGYVIIAMVVLYKFSFGMSWGFGAWLYIPEILPLRIRGAAVGLCTGMNWGPANITSAFITPAMIAGPMGAGGTLLFFGCVSALTVPFAATCLPETKGKTLEEIAPLFRFSGCREFCGFVRGNLRGGLGYAGGTKGGSKGISAKAANEEPGCSA